MRRRGYTYAELMVVITVIGVLVALLLPAVQACREAARRSTCSRRLNQLIIAVQNYEFHHGVYPAGTMDAQGPIRSQPVGYHHNWIIQILPFLELKNASRRINPLVGVYDPQYNELRRMELAILRCPSFGYAITARGYSDFAGMHNSFEAPIDVDNDGVFFLNSRIRYEDLWDGSSHTIFIGEKWTPRGDLGWMSGTRSTLRNAGVPLNATGGFSVSMWAGKVNRFGSEPKASAVDDAEAAARDENLSDELLLALLLGPRDDLGPVSQLGNKPRKRISRPKVVQLAVGGFSSPHPGGAQFALGDGSVRYLSSTMDPIAYANLANRADGNIQSMEY
jgi:prepilin-type N-terminal cleavage/methylation domain-containing protein/prepilin-type processing-associated H-X9-DG protein